MLYLIVDAGVNGSVTHSDALRGVELMQQYSDGAPFNTLNYPNVDSPLVSYYVTWWSQGQWVIPYAIAWLLNFDSIQHWQTVIIGACMLASVFGYFKLFRKLGWNKLITNISLFCIVTNQLFYVQSLSYTGGNILFLAFFPWMLLVFLNLTNRNDYLKIILFFIGCFLKNTTLIVLVCGALFLVFNERKDFIKYSVLYTGTLVFIISTVYLVYLQYGASPGSSFDLKGYGDFENSFSRDLLTAIGSPISIFTRFGLFDGSTILGVSLIWIKRIAI